ncbi:hypothetical protein NDU88_002530 [Pleurodeles waltl]|uniref:Uncharacterized protein n=1 Tax=Pleurodeles waltl TaxID=8319 RepID=A0AAV7KSY1_PLEWA|nr:hypothetical protein NDU88_002530 [Pleurodeles waltl]
MESRDSQEPSMSDILNEIKGTHTELVIKIDIVALDVTLLRADLHKVADTITEAGDTIGVLNREVDALKDAVSSLQKLTVHPEEWAEEVEGRSHQNNLRFRSFPEWQNGATCTNFGNT